MIKLLYDVRCYNTKDEAESGQHFPTYKFSTGSYITAEKDAKELLEYCGFVVVVNNETGQRTVFNR